MPLDDYRFNAQIPTGRIRGRLRDYMTNQIIEVWTPNRKTHKSKEDLEGRWTMARILKINREEDTLVVQYIDQKGNITEDVELREEKTMAYRHEQSQKQEVARNAEDPDINIELDSLSCDSTMLTYTTENTHQVRYYDMNQIYKDNGLEGGIESDGKGDTAFFVEET